jgi:hypothetical protein
VRFACHRGLDRCSATAVHAPTEYVLRSSTRRMHEPGAIPHHATLDLLNGVK